MTKQTDHVEDAVVAQHLNSSEPVNTMAAPDQNAEKVADKPVASIEDSIAAKEDSIRDLVVKLNAVAETASPEIQNKLLDAQAIERTMLNSMNNIKHEGSNLAEENDHHAVSEPDKNAEKVTERPVALAEISLENYKLLSKEYFKAAQGDTMRNLVVRLSADADADPVSPAMLNRILDAQIVEQSMKENNVKSIKHGGDHISDANIHHAIADLLEGDGIPNFSSEKRNAVYYDIMVGKEAQTKSPEQGVER